MQGVANEVDEQKPQEAAAETEKDYEIYCLVEPSPGKLWLLATIAAIAGAGALFVLLVKILV